MGYMPSTPFRRTVDAALQQHSQLDDSSVPPTGVDKWEALRTLGVARKRYGLSDRELSVLQALISFHPSRTLDPRGGPLVVYPSNRTICKRLNGMPCSTMRRHIARLVTVGLIIRRDSPNGKRYSRRYAGEKIAFGFDLTPLAARFKEFSDAAQDVQQTEERLRHQRETVSLMRRDLGAFIEYGMATTPDLSAWQSLADLATEAARSLRRKLDPSDLSALETRLKQALQEAEELLSSSRLSTRPTHSEHHNQSPIKESESESTPPPAATHPPGLENESSQRCLRQVLALCPRISEYSQGPLRHWGDLVRTADTLAPMLGISRSAWVEARCAMGPADAATVLSILLERTETIRKPGAYLRCLADKARAGAFTPGPMLRSLQARSSQL